LTLYICNLYIIPTWVTFIKCFAKIKKAWIQFLKSAKWSESFICPIFKSEDQNNPENYRGIAINNSIGKVFNLMTLYICNLYIIPTWMTIKCFAKINIVYLLGCLPFVSTFTSLGLCSWVVQHFCQISKFPINRLLLLYACYTFLCHHAAFVIAFGFIKTRYVTQALMSLWFLFSYHQLIF
jgi:hypothetical protein